MECQECLEIVSEKRFAKHRKYGILDMCDHRFCIECVYGFWKSKTCPVCGTVSTMYLPSARWLEPQEKAGMLPLMVESYRANKPCRYFAQGNGICRYGASCRYRHDPMRGPPYLKCHLCCDEVSSNSQAWDRTYRMYALMTNCNHCFCVQCISVFWNTYSALTGICPICQTRSMFAQNPLQNSFAVQSAVRAVGTYPMTESGY